MMHRTMTQALAGGRESVGGIAFTRDELTTERVSFEAGIGRQVPTGVSRRMGPMMHLTIH